MSAELMTGRRSTRLRERALLVLLLLAVPILSTAAKRNWYLPRANAAHHLTAAVKMKVTLQPMVFNWPPAQPAPKVVLLSPQTSQRFESEPEIPVRSIALTVVPQLRAPPALLSV